jgi:hypothetical protein
MPAYYDRVSTAPGLRCRSAFDPQRVKHPLPVEDEAAPCQACVYAVSLRRS